MAALDSRLSTLCDAGALIEVLSNDTRPTFILELSEKHTQPNRLVFHNNALGSLVSTPAELRAFEKWIEASYADLLKGGDDFTCFGGRTWSSKHFRETWRLISCNPDAPRKDSLVQTSSIVTPDAQTNTMCQRSGNICNVLNPPTPPTPPISQYLFGMEKSSRKLVDWTLADAASPWLRFVKKFPWSTTPYGPIELWPYELRRSAADIMYCPDPRILIFGEQQTIMYNEAFASNIGDHHPSSMGLSLLDITAEGVFDILKAPTQTAYDNGRVTSMTNEELLIDRNGITEQTFWNFHILPLPGPDGYCNSVIGEFTEVTELALQDQRRLQGIDVFRSIEQVETLPELWSRFLSVLEEDASDISYATVYSAVDASSQARPDLLPTPLSESLATPYTQAEAFGFANQFQLVDSIGVPENAFESVVDLATAETSAVPTLAQMLLEAFRTKEIVAVHDSSMPKELAIAVSGLGLVKAACVLPVMDLNGKPLAFVVLGINPRRPYTDRTSRFMYCLREAVCKHAIHITLPEEQQKFQKKYEETTTALSHQLQLSLLKAKKKEERFSRIARSAPLGMYLYSPKDKVIHVNDAYLKMTGATKESLQKESVSGLPWLQTVSEEFLEAAIKEWQDLMTNKTPSALEYKIRGQPDEEMNPRWVSATYFPSLDEHGEVDMVHGWLADITDTKMKQTLLAQRLEDALETKKVTEHFLDMVSHEMRNPLSAIFQSSDEILETIQQWSSPKDSEAVCSERLKLIEEAAETIALCATHQKSIFDDILTVSKLDSNLLTIVPEQVRPVDVIQKAFKMYEQEARRSDIKLSVNIQDSFGKHVDDLVMLDPIRLLQVIINLLTNAIKHTRTSKERSISISLGASTVEPTGGDLPTGFMLPPPKKLGTPLTPSPEMDEFSAAFGSNNIGDYIFLQLTVQDTGSGMNDSEMSCLFKKFSQAKTYSSYGSGLGLYLSKELIELQGGRIGVRSTEGEGTSFTFYVKCKRCVSNTLSLGAIPDLQPNNVLPPTKPATALGHRPRVSRTEAFDAKDLANRQPSPMRDIKIIVCEDNLVNQRVMAKQLRAQGFTVFTANHGGEALDLLIPPPPTGKTRFDIILMDIEMPVMDGLTCVKKIRELEARGDLQGKTPIVAVTANARSEQVQTAIEAGMDDVVTKPFRIVEVVGLIKSLVGSGRVLNEK